MNPLYKHDSDCCKFINVGLDEFGVKCDIYVCKDVVIFRYSDEPSDNRTVKMEKINSFPVDYKDILNNKELMTQYNKVN